VNYIGRNIKLYREANSLTQKEIADYIGVQREVVSYYETGERNPPVAILMKISDVFGVELDELLEESLDIAKDSLVLAFRSDSLDRGNLEEIVNFKKIIKNYIKMERLIIEYGV